MIKSHSNQENGRHQFSALDMLDQALGLPTPEGYAVITKEFARYLKGELERLYAIEDCSRFDRTEEYELLQQIYRLYGDNMEVFRPLLSVGEGTTIHTLHIVLQVMNSFIETSKKTTITKRHQSSYPSRGIKS